MLSKKDISGQRIYVEWRNWNKNHPSGIRADPIKKPNGLLNLRRWECLIPGPKSSPWEAASYKMIMRFPDDFPVLPPICRFDPPIFHPNVSTTGEVFIPELCKKMFWRPYFNIELIMWHIQNMLELPNVFEATNDEAKEMYITNFHEYERQVRINAEAMRANEENYWETNFVS